VFPAVFSSLVGVGIDYASPNKKCFDLVALAFYFEAALGWVDILGVGSLARSMGVSPLIRWGIWVISWGASMLLLHCVFTRNVPFLKLLTPLADDLARPGGVAQKQLNTRMITFAVVAAAGTVFAAGGAGVMLHALVTPLHAVGRAVTQAVGVGWFGYSGSIWMIDFLARVIREAVALATVTAVGFVALVVTYLGWGGPISATHALLNVLVRGLRGLAVWAGAPL
jgi:hypothetical protein